MELLESQKVVLASLLHDIGKFGQRAEAPCSENLAHEYCPGGTSHRHVLYTDWFIEKHLPLPPELEGFRSALARMASAHHKADSASREEMCIQDGDRLSSGNDRIEGESGGTYKSARMESVFSQVHLRRHRLDDEPRRYMLKALDAEGSPLFPVEQGKAQATGYAALYAEFLAALKALPLDMGVAHYLASMQTVLERFTWCIPSSTYNTRADISLFDHSFTTAAIAQALYHGGKPATALRQTPLLLFGGELSGIQNFIFGQGEQGDRGASKLLRARSFSLQMLTRSIWLVLLERCGLCSVARIMDAGGRFILLLPDTPAVREAIDSVSREAMRHVLEAFNGVVRVSFAMQELKAADLDMDSFHAVFQQMNDRLEREKLRPFAPLLAEGFSPVIGIKSADYAEHGPCPFCGLRPAQGEEGDEAGCRICSALIQQVGRRLPEARFAVFSREGKGFPLFGGLRLRLETQVPARADASALDILSLKDRTAFSASPTAGYVPRITETDLLRWEAEKRSMPEDDGPLALGTPKTFGVLAQEARIPAERGFRSIPCLAACKADVDNLGMIFGIGLESGGKSRFSISHFAMLSRMMHHFFSSHLIRVIEEEFPDIYVVFAGGDDLFVLGPWSDTVRFAETLYDSFLRFTGGNPDVTLSAGVALAKSGLPMRSIKELAEEQLEASKARTEDGTPAKDAVTLFGVTCPWAEFSSRLEQGEWLEDLCLEGGVTQGFVRRLLGYSRQARAFAAGDISAGLYRSHMIYDMARNCKKDLDQDDKDDLLALCHDKGFEQMEISITWALYRTRTTA
ncbi:type III-A CRISPR-associated protein Cas10/Csm1 [Mailhella sp.]